jgi:ribosomal protein L11 methyltransferase
MAWIQLALYADTGEAERLGDALTEIGAVAVTLSDAADEEIFEPPPGEMPLWHSTKVFGLFDAEDYRPAQILDLLKAQYSQRLPLYEFSRLEDKDWERAWLDEFKPMLFGRRVWVVPTVFDPPASDAVNIRLDPGLAFGTGTHATTALCLEWLDGHDIEGKTVIDFGCGSGILAIAAALLNAQHVWATDIDPQAIQASKSNALLNGVDRKLTIDLPKELELPKVEVLLANILANPLKVLAEEFSQKVIAGGKIVLSGVLATQADEVCAAYAEWFELDDVKQKDDWVLITGTRN